MTLTCRNKDSLAKDYEAMSGMVFGKVPPLADVLAAIATLEVALNTRKSRER